MTCEIQNWFGIQVRTKLNQFIKTDYERNPSSLPGRNGSQGFLGDFPVRVGWVLWEQRGESTHAGISILTHDILFWFIKGTVGAISGDSPFSEFCFIKKINNFIFES